MAIGFFCTDLPCSGVVLLLVRDVSAITISSDDGGDSESLLLSLVGLTIFVMNLHRQSSFRESEVLPNVCFRG